MYSFFSRSSILFRITGLYGCLLFSLTSVLAQGTGGSSSNTPNPGRSAAHTVRGKVFLPSGMLPEQRLRVVLELTTGGVANETFSDSVGNFEFRSVSSSTYRVVVPSDGRSYETTQETVEVYGNFARTFMVQVYLREKTADPMSKTNDKMVAAAPFKQKVPKDAEKLFEKAEKKSRDKKPDEAISLLQESLRVFPDYLLALNKLGEQYLSIQRPEEARQSFEKALAVDSKFPLAHINLGMLLFNLKQYPEAVNHLESANHMDEGYPMSHLYLGLALMEVEPLNYDRAEKELLKAQELGGKNLVQVRKYLFNLNYRRNTLDKAVVHLEAYLKEAPDAADAPKIQEILDKVRKMLVQQTSQSAQPQKP